MSTTRTGSTLGPSAIQGYAPSDILKIIEIVSSLVVDAGWIYFSFAPVRRMRAERLLDVTKRILESALTRLDHGLFTQLWIYVVAPNPDQRGRFHAHGFFRTRLDPEELEKSAKRPGLLGTSKWSVRADRVRRHRGDPFSYVLGHLGSSWSLFEASPEMHQALKIIDG